MGQSSMEQPPRLKVTLAECVDNRDQTSDVDVCINVAKVNLVEKNVNKLKVRLTDSRKQCRRLKSQVSRLRSKLALLKEQSEQSSRASKNQVVNYVNEHLSGVRKAFVLAQIEDEGNRNGRRWGQEMIQFAALLYNQNRQCYNTLSGCLSMPHKKTLSRAMHRATPLPSSAACNGEHLTKQLAEQMKIKRTATGEIMDDNTATAAAAVSNSMLRHLDELMDSTSDNLEVDDTSVCSEIEY